MAMNIRIAQLAIVGIVALLSAANPTAVHAQTPAGQAAGKAPAAGALVGDDALVQARRAFVRGEQADFEAAAAQVPGDHPLARYIEFWRLRLALQLAEEAEVPAAEARDRRIRRFLAEHDGTVVAELMRRDWLLDLGKRRNWPIFDQQYARWTLRNADTVHCHHWLGRIERRWPAGGAWAAVSAPRHLEEACGDLLAAMQAAGLADRQAIRARLLAALEADSLDSTERSAALLGLDPATVDLAWRQPLAVLARGQGGELALIALARYARSQPVEAARWLEDRRTALPAADLAFAWSQVAAAGMRRLLPEAFDWTRHALHAPVGDDTLAWLVRAALREQHWPTVRRLIERMSDAGRSDPAWVYWHARALLAGGAATPDAAARDAAAPGDTAAGRAALAGIADGFHFYGQLAAEELGQPLRIPARAAAASPAELAEVAANPGLARALHLYRIGLRLEGNREWNHQLRDMNDRQLLATARWACAQQILDRCVNTAERTTSEHDFSLRFVTPFIDALRPVAASRQLDPAWVYGLIRQESRFIMDARSSAGAQGLMQIMPATGRWIARQLGTRQFRVAQLNQLDTNLEFGTFYLRTVLDRLDGSPVLASAAYNAGPGRPLDWRTRLGSPVEGAIFAEIIPFSETRDYVKKVLSNTVLYAELFSERPQSLKARLGIVLPAQQS
ncbi:MAG: transglycosylase SLT domain-containing protein [Burkholderiaceae bacterium]